MYALYPPSSFFLLLLLFVLNSPQQIFNVFIKTQILRVDPTASRPLTLAIGDSIGMSDLIARYSSDEGVEPSDGQREDGGIGAGERSAVQRQDEVRFLWVM